MDVLILADSSDVAELCAWVNRIIRWVVFDIEIQFMYFQKLVETVPVNIIFNTKRLVISPCRGIENISFSSFLIARTDQAFKSRWERPYKRTLVQSEGCCKTFFFIRR